MHIDPARSQETQVVKWSRCGSECCALLKSRQNNIVVVCSVLHKKNTEAFLSTLILLLFLSKFYTLVQLSYTVPGYICRAQNWLSGYWRLGGVNRFPGECTATAGPRTRPQERGLLTHCSEHFTSWLLIWLLCCIYRIVYSRMCRRPRSLAWYHLFLETLLQPDSQGLGETNVLGWSR